MVYQKYRVIAPWRGNLHNFLWKYVQSMLELSVHCFLFVLFWILLYFGTYYPNCPIYRVSWAGQLCLHRKRWLTLVARLMLFLFTLLMNLFIKQLVSNLCGVVAKQAVCYNEAWQARWEIATNNEHGVPNKGSSASAASATNGNWLVYQYRIVSRATQELC